MTITIRNFTFDDLPALAAVINRAAAADQEDYSTTLEDLRTRFERPYFYPEDNCFVAVLPEGTLVGYTTADLDPRVGLGWGMGCVDPAYRRQGIGRALIDRGEARHHERAQTELAPHLGLSVRRFCRDTNVAARALYESVGYAVWRASWLMHIDFDGTLPETPLPDGFGLQAFDRARDARHIWEIEQEIFRETPGFIQPPFEVWESIVFLAGHDDAMWLIAVDQRLDGKPVVGVCLCESKPDKPDTGWVNTLGVRPAYRKRGLGLALLKRSFQVMQAHGFSAVELEVDTENTSNAVALYQRAGMRADRCYPIYRKVLREAK